MMQQMTRWAKSDNHHVRRLATEGCRPRLPWAISLPAFKKDPKPVLVILKTLIKDDSEYVRRSVANNLNDISKDHPEIVTDGAQRWFGKNKNSDQPIEHACRSLLKQGDARALSLFGFTDAKHVKAQKLKVQPEVKQGEKLVFSFLLKSQNPALGRCRIEFSIDFMKANSKQNRKMFKISEGDYTEKEKQVSKYFSFKKSSTRKYYTGEHQITIVINGVDQATESFELVF